ncbi:MAG: methyltransferase domain-containing protein [Lachnospiraceae bacterium]|nr:methyltransferase domain-containing protein [Lachnospiraceae bacterium]MBO5176764.1 methyltransferase domain-containing protein [Lachnospiraceae bacterium]
MDLDKVIKETRNCAWQLQKLDIENKYELYSMDRLMAEIAVETKQMKDSRLISAQIEKTEPVQYQENITQNKTIRGLDEKLSRLGIYRVIRACTKKVYRFFAPYRTVDGKEILKNDGELFARIAYKSILLREIDKDALENVLVNLENRKITKADFLYSLCISEEGKKYGITVKGLRKIVWKEKLVRGIKRIPVLGYALRWIKCIIFLPRMLANTQSSINDLVLYDRRKNKLLMEQQNKLDMLRRDLEFAVLDHDEKTNEREQNLWDSMENLEDMVSQLSEKTIDEITRLRGDIEQEIASVVSEVELGTRQFIEVKENLQQISEEEKRERQNLISEQRRLAEQLAQSELWKKEEIQEIVRLKDALDILQKSCDEKITVLLKAIIRNEMDIKEVSLWREEQVKRELDEKDNMLQVKKILNAFYMDYNEKIMCDSREEVAERQKQYLPFVEQCLGDKTDDLVMIDLGCGEGEFVELLNQNGYPAYGVDSNPMVIDKVKGINSDIRIEESEATAYLATLEDNSVDFISCFHMVEHLETGELLELLKESHRVLKVGGGLILETPNPLNILISTYYFYMDPTHKKQIPPELLNLMVSSSGFKVEECRMLRPLNFVPYSYDDPNDKIRDIVFRFNMEQAYSLMAVKE